MADLLIKNVEMPKSCYTCQFGDNYEGSFCLATNDEHQIDHMTAIRRRPKWCPLVEIKEHGRLGDLDLLTRTIITCIKDAEKEYSKEDIGLVKAIYESVLYHIGKAPTILEASA